MLPACADDGGWANESAGRGRCRRYGRPSGGGCAGSNPAGGTTFSRTNAATHRVDGLVMVPVVVRAAYFWPPWQPGNRVAEAAGIDPVTKRRHYLKKLVPAGTPSAWTEAENIRTGLVNQVNEHRHPPTRATVNQCWTSTSRPSTSRRAQRTRTKAAGEPVERRDDAEVLQQAHAVARDRDAFRQDRPQLPRRPSDSYRQL